MSSYRLRWFEVDSRCEEEGSRKVQEVTGGKTHLEWAERCAESGDLRKESAVSLGQLLAPT